MKYRHLFASRPEFFRSVRIDLDTERMNGKFITTPLFGKVAERIVSGLSKNGPRAITITGPYGSGKSATTLQVIKMLETKSKELISSLETIRPDLIPFVQSTNGIEPLLINGSSGRIGMRIVESIRDWAMTKSKSNITDLVSNTDPNNLEAVVELVDQVRKSLGGRSLVVVIDELGKHLEFASIYPDDNDVYLLQLLAETADRSQSPTMSFITILHQAFENYGNKLLHNQRDEFAKVQGRFEDIAFQLTNEDSSRIIASTIQATCLDASSLNAARLKATEIGADLFDIGCVPAGISKEDFLVICKQSAPLHPATTLLLGPLFRYFAQNERSLFGMLGSDEPHGFQRFLDTTDYDPSAPKLYGLPELFEYISASLGGAIYNSLIGRRWVQIDAALARVGDNYREAIDLIKVMGLIDLAPNHRIIPSSQVLELIAENSVLSTLDYLNKKSITVYRRFSDSYRLWDGSDIDIEGQLEEARKQIGVPALVTSLMELTPPKPIMARKHSMQTGTLRWFDTTYIEPYALDNLADDQKPNTSDGRMYVVISTQGQQPPKNIQLRDWQVVVWTELPLSIWEAICELSYIRWVKDHTPELRQDDIARREVMEREHALEQLVEVALGNHLLRPDKDLTVYANGQIKLTVRGNQLNTVISSVCDKLFPNAPKIINEFVNRSTLSSAATAARNDVLKRMIDSPHKENLGIEGYPPQLPIYLSTLKQPGLHVERNGNFLLTAPGESSTWRGPWKYIEFLVNDEYRSLANIWESLSLPPYGMRSGLLPLLTIAFLSVNRNKLSILEQENFVPELSVAVMERLLRNPETFRIKISKLIGSRKVLVETMIREKVLGETSRNEETDLLSIVRPLVSFSNKLPDYTKNTKNLSDTAIRVRDVLISAREPVQLLFADLPVALGYGEIVEHSNAHVIPELVEHLIGSIRELASCYPALLESIQAILQDAFGLKGLSITEAKNQLRTKSSSLLTVVKDTGMKSIIWRMSQDIDTNPWTESVASVTSNKPPRNWFDRTLREFEIEIHMIARKFRHFETLASVFPKAGSNEVPMRISLTTDQQDLETVVSSFTEQSSEIRGIVEDVVLKLKSNSENELLIVAAELIKRFFETEYKEDEQHAK